MSRIFTLASIVIHAIGIGALCIVQLLAVGTPPVPRQPLTLEGSDVMRLADVPVPPPPHRQSGPTTAHSSDAAPVEAPRGITAESPPSSASDTASAPGEAAGIEHGAGFMSSIGIVENPAPPPEVSRPRQPLRLHTGVQPPWKIVDRAPIYPSIARAARVQGVVILEAVIDASGNVESARILRSIPMLDEAALDAVRQWKYAPALLNGERVAVVMTVTMRFVLDEGSR